MLTQHKEYLSPQARKLTSTLAISALVPVKVTTGALYDSTLPIVKPLVSAQVVASAALTLVRLWSPILTVIKYMLQASTAARMTSSRKSMTAWLIIWISVCAAPVGACSVASSGITAEAVVALYNDSAPDPFSMLENTIYAPTSAFKPPSPRHKSVVTFNTGPLKPNETYYADPEKITARQRAKTKQVMDWLSEEYQRGACIITLTELAIHSDKEALALQRTFSSETRMKALVCKGKPQDKHAGVAVLWDPGVLTVALSQEDPG